MSDENSDRRPPYRSLDEIRAAILEMQVGYKAAGLESTPMNREIKLDTDGEDLIFVGEPVLAHSCAAMRCRSGEHVVFRVSFANLLITRKAKRLVRNFLGNL